MTAGTAVIFTLALMAAAAGAWALAHFRGILSRHRGTHRGAGR